MRLLYVRRKASRLTVFCLSFNNFWCTSLRPTPCDQVLFSLRDPALFSYRKISKALLVKTLGLGVGIFGYGGRLEFFMDAALRHWPGFGKRMGRLYAL
jgi:hypothetical protein